MFLCSGTSVCLGDVCLSGKIKGRKLGRKIVYTRQDVLAALEAVDAEDRGMDPSQRCVRRKT